MRGTLTELQRSPWPVAPPNVPVTFGVGLSEARLSALSDAIAGLAAEYGRGTARATSWRLGGTCVGTVLEDFMTPAERELAETVDAELLRGIRCAFVSAVGAEYIRAAERALGREVVAHHSELICHLAACIEIFVLGRVRHPGVGFMDPPVAGSPA